MNEPVDSLYYNGYWYHRSNEKNLFKSVDEELDHIEHNEEAIWDKIQQRLSEIAEKALGENSE